MNNWIATEGSPFVIVEQQYANQWNGRYGRMKNENPEKSLWRSESNAKEFCLKRPCVFLKTLRSFGTNALMSFSRTLK